MINLSQITTLGIQFFLALLLNFVPWLSHAEIPKTITYQGYLSDSTGKPIQGNVDLTFSLTDSTWQESHPAVSVNQGVFTVNLGSITFFDNKVDFNKPHYLNIQASVGGTAISVPAAPLSSVPYAFVAKQAGNADFATNAGTANKAGTADSATTAQTAVNATNAQNATNATNATNAQTANYATKSGDLELRPDKVSVLIGGACVTLADVLICYDDNTKTQRLVFTGPYKNLDGLKNECYKFYGPNFYPISRLTVLVTCDGARL